MSAAAPVLPAFCAYGIELEYMIVDSGDLSVRPFGDRWLQQVAGTPGMVNDVERGLLGWSNELVMHVIELKNLHPTTALHVLQPAMQAEIRFANRMLEHMHARLMPSAMHPWMNPREETHVWPHHNAALYAAYDRIFGARSHGWANLQSMHINLPFADDSEFARLHAAIRLVLPILPALAASSPICEARRSGFMDYRMEVYRHNADLIPSIAGAVIPESVRSRAEYCDIILAPMMRDIAPHDPGRLLCHEWLNSRGAIARFDRNTIEIRIIDVQECPKADLAIAAATIGAVKALYDEKWLPHGAQQNVATAGLAALLAACIRDADQALIDDAAYLRHFGFPGARCTASELWLHLAEQSPHGIAGGAWADTLRALLRHGPLARRIARAVGDDYSQENLQAVYRALCDCLQQGRLFQWSA